MHNITLVRVYNLSLSFVCVYMGYVLRNSDSAVRVVEVGIHYFTIRNIMGTQKPICVCRGLQTLSIGGSFPLKEIGGGTPSSTGTAPKVRGWGLGPLAGALNPLCASVTWGAFQGPPLPDPLPPQTSLPGQGRGGRGCSPQGTPVGSKRGRLTRSPPRR